jgi:hypothetical protein
MSGAPAAVVVLPPGALASCPHGGRLATVAPATNVTASGRPLVTSIVPAAIAGCPFTLPSGTPHPCALLSGVRLSGRVLVNGRPALLAPGPVLCLAADQAAQGPPLLLSTAPRVAAL